MSHWYTKEGQPMHWVVGKNGKERGTTLRDAREMNLFPSVTEILNLVAKPGLTNWMIDQALLAALTLPRKDGESLDDFIIRAKRDAEQQGKDAMNLGTEIHNSIELMFRGAEPVIHIESSYAVRNLVEELTGKWHGWIPEKTFASPDGFGGMVDLHHPDGLVIDYKTKDKIEEGKKLAWDEHFLQLSAYAHGLGMPNATKINIFVSRTQPGVVAYHKWEGDGYERFKYILNYWQATKGYKP